MIYLYKYLINEEFRYKLENSLMKNVPEILECDVNFSSGFLKFIEYNRPDNTARANTIRGGYLHHFSLVSKATGSISHQVIWHAIFEDTELDTFENKDIGYKAKEGMKYPNLDEKVKLHIKEFVREHQLSKIL